METQKLVNEELVNNSNQLKITKRIDEFIIELHEKRLDEQNRRYDLGDEPNFDIDDPTPEMENWMEGHYYSGRESCIEEVIEELEQLKYELKTKLK